jgi:hypothetical protein
VVANVVGFTAGGAIGGAIARALELPYLGVTSASAAALALTRAAGAACAALGVAVGTTQWLAIRGDLKHVGWWIPATIVGWALAALGVGTLSGIMGGAVTGVGPDLGLLGYVVSAAAGILAIGLLSVVCQWLVLRGRVHRASQWVWGAGATFFLAAVAAFAVVRWGLVNLIGWLRLEDFPSAKSFVLMGVLIGLLYGVASGALLVRLLGRSLAERPQEKSLGQ